MLRNVKLSTCLLPLAVTALLFAFTGLPLPITESTSVAANSRSGRNADKVSADLRDRLRVSAAGSSTVPVTGDYLLGSGIIISDGIMVSDGILSSDSTVQATSTLANGDTTAAMNP